MHSFKNFNNKIEKCVCKSDYVLAYFLKKDEIPDKFALKGAHH